MCGRVKWWLISCWYDCEKDRPSRWCCSDKLIVIPSPVSHKWSLQGAYFDTVAKNSYGYNQSYSNGHGDKIANPGSYFKVRMKPDQIDSVIGFEKLPQPGGFPTSYSKHFPCFHESNNTKWSMATALNIIVLHLLSCLSL